MSTKIKPTHIGRSAYIYVRQSTAHQVQHHLESQERQYELANAATKLGWSEAQVIVIDDDLGKSASGVAGRLGFQRLVSEVAMGRAGIVLGLEVSRLARNNRDWYQLLDLCAARQTLIGDTDGIYDPAAYNDRLLLGLKGTMSEAELHTLKERMVAGMRHKADKGELRYRLPAGYEYDDDNRIVKTSDERVRHFIEALFAKLFEVGSVNGVTKFLAHEGLRMPRRAVDGSIRWVTPYYRGVLLMLTNPIFAGAYAYGRSEAVMEMDADARATTRRRAKPMAKWDVLIHDHHPAYVSRDQFERIREMVEKNRPAPRHEASRALREGGALLQGLARCGKCGRAMTVKYNGTATAARQSAFYACHASRAQMRAGFCLSIGARRIDAAVARIFLETLTASSLAVHLSALRKLDDGQDAVTRQLELQLESARYEAQRLERQYNAVEPENRVVARTLETRWNVALDQVQQLEHQVGERRREMARRLSEVEERRLIELAQHLPALWAHERVTDRDRKALLRAAIEEVQIDRASNTTQLKLVWKGGAIEEISFASPRFVPPPATTPAELVELVRALATRHSDAQIARILARRRIKTPKKHLAFNTRLVCDLRHSYGIPRCAEPSPDQSATSYTGVQAARLMGVSETTIYSWVKLGLLHGEQVSKGAPWTIEITDAERIRFAPTAPPGWRRLEEAAREIGVSKQTILNWVKAGKVAYVYATRGRRRGLMIDVKSAPYSSQQSLVD